jgi:protocatechuate 3,4-dioxygenase beta subunit
MSLSKLAALSYTVALALLGCCLPARAQGPQTGAPGIAGRVVDEAGAGIPGARVYLISRSLVYPDMPLRVREARSRPDGSFAFPAARPVRGQQWTSLLAIKTGYGAGGSSLEEGARLRARGRTEIDLAPPGELAGEVLDMAGRPIAGARVRAASSSRRRPGGWDSFSVPEGLDVLSARTDLHGKFRIFGAPEGGNFTLEVTHPDYAGIFTRDTLGASDITLNLEPAAQIQGRVVDDRGKPAAGVTVLCVRKGGDYFPRPSTKTDAAGRFALRELHAGTYLVYLAYPEPGPGRIIVPRRVEGVPAGGWKRCPDLRLISGVVVKGRVTDGDTGRPLVGMRVNTLQMRGNLYIYGPSAMTRADGTYSLHLYPGKWQVSVWAQRGYLPKQVDVEVGSGKSLATTRRALWSLAVAKTAEVRGLVLDPNGKPAPRAIIFSSPYGYRATTAADGAFTLEGYYRPGNALNFYASSADGALAGTAAATASRAKDGRSARVTIRLAPCVAVAGRVVDEEGRPLERARVEAECRAPLGARSNETFSTLATVLTTDPEGRFTLRLLPAATYDLRAGAAGYADARRRGVVAAAGEHAGTFTLKRTDRGIRGRVTDMEGRPVANARIMAWLREMEIAREARTDGAGMYRLTGLPPGRVSVMLSHSRYESDWRTDVETGSTGVDFTLVPRRDPRPPATLKPGSVAPEIDLLAEGGGTREPPGTAVEWISGTPIRSWRDLHGKVVVLQFACAHNAAVEAVSRTLADLHRRYAGRGLVVLAIFDASLSARETAEYVRGQALPYPVGIVPATTQMGWDTPPFRQYGVDRLPGLFVIDRQGKVRLANAPSDRLEAAVRGLLASR